ncbi:hypothetical protein CDAR_284431 [Caerostris darwini]|uniref:Uncharacterized protein n=1 Tax=Caerostris darwini TaxID=1538125 RepID=A0AAV4UJJ9_9ARAC|nr:hypothetical protein CDAR_284431 [Caerostris darwini]
MSMLFGSMRKSRSTSSSHSLPSPARLSEGCNAQLDISFMKQLAKEAKILSCEVLSQKEKNSQFRKTSMNDTFDALND